MNHSMIFHSGIPGSKVACTYPGPIAAYHALLRRPSLTILQMAYRIERTYLA